MKKINKVKIAVNALKTVKTVEYVGIGMAFLPIGGLVGGVKGMKTIGDVVVDDVKSMWTR